MYIIIDDRIQHVGDGMWLSMIKVTIELNYYATSPFDVRCPFHVEKTAVSSSSKHSDWWWTPKKASWRSWNNSWGLDLRPWLVGGLEHEFYDFPYIGNVIIPTDFHIFQRGRLKPPTRWGIHTYLLEKVRVIRQQEAGARGRIRWRSDLHPFPPKKTNPHNKHLEYPPVV